MAQSPEHFSDDPDFNEFCNDLLAGVAELKSGRGTRSTRVEVSWITHARNKTGLTQKQFAKLLGVTEKTLESWERGEKKPSGAASTVLMIADREPGVLSRLASVT